MIVLSAAVAAEEELRILHSITWIVYNEYSWMCVCDQIELLNLVLNCIDLNRWLVFGRLNSGVRVVREMITLDAVI